MKRNDRETMNKRDKIKEIKAFKEKTHFKGIDIKQSKVQSSEQTASFTLNATVTI